jgi:hypothetical protein
VSEDLTQMLMWKGEEGEAAGEEHLQKIWLELDQ